MTEMSFQHYLLGLFAVANNIAALPSYIILIQGRTNKEQHKLCRIATLASFITMISSLFFSLITLAIGIQFIITGISGAYPKIL